MRNTFFKATDYQFIPKFRVLFDSAPIFFELKIILDSIEYLLSAEKLDLVIQACHSGQVKKANQTAISEWTYVLKWEENLLECRIRYGANQVNAITCACGSHSAQTPCIHAWTLAYWHQHERGKAYSAQQQTRSVRKSTRDELQQKSSEELAGFADLALSLYPDLYRWAQILMPVRDRDTTGFEFYSHALKAFRPEVKPKSSGLTIKDLRLRLQLLERLHEKAIFQMLRGEILEPAEMILALLSESYQWLESFQAMNTEKLSARMIQLTQTLGQIIKSAKAPDIRQHLFDLLIELIVSQKTWILHRQDNLLACVYLFTEKKQALKEFDKQSLGSVMAREEFFGVPSETLGFLYDHYDYAHWENWIKKNQLDARIPLGDLLNFVRGLAGMVFDEKALALLRCLSRSAQHPEIRLSAALLHLEHLIRHQDKVQIVEWSRKYAIELGDLRFIRIWHESARPGEDEIGELVHELKKKRGNQPVFMLESLSILNAWDMLCEEVEKNGEISVILKYDSVLAMHYPERILQLHLRHTRAYLDEHGGTKAFDYVQQIKNHLRREVSRDLEARYSAALEELYPDRISLFSEQKKNLNSII